MLGAYLLDLLFRDCFSCRRALCSRGRDKFINLSLGKGSFGIARCSLRHRRARLLWLYTSNKTGVFSYRLAQPSKFRRRYALIEPWVIRPHVVGHEWGLHIVRAVAGRHYYFAFFLQLPRLPHDILLRS